MSMAHLAYDAPYMSFYVPYTSYVPYMSAGAAQAMSMTHLAYDALSDSMQPRDAASSFFEKVVGLHAYVRSRTWVWVWVWVCFMCVCVCVCVCTRACVYITTHQGEYCII